MEKAIIIKIESILMCVKTAKQSATDEALELDNRYNTLQSLMTMSQIKGAVENWVYRATMRKLKYREP